MLERAAAAQVLRGLGHSLDELEHQQRPLRHVVDHLRPDTCVGRGNRVQVLVLAVDREHPGILGRDTHDVGALGGIHLVVGVRQPARELGDGAAIAERGHQLEQLLDAGVVAHRATIRGRLESGATHGRCLSPTVCKNRGVQEELARAQVVVIGGGITGCSVAYHLARAGVRDVMLVEKGELTSGSTCHAAGLVTQFNPSATMMRFRRYSVELYRELGVFETVGSLRIASSPDSLLELRRGAARARGIGLDVEVLGPDEATALMPAATSESLYGAVWIADDGCVDPHTATYALADAARHLGVSIHTRTRVTGIELGEDRRVAAVHTERGRIETEGGQRCGMWGPQVAAMVGAFAPRSRSTTSTWRWRRWPGTSCPTTCPASGIPTTWCTGSRRPAACCSAATSRTPCRAGRTACPGSTARHAAGRP